MFNRMRFICVLISSSLLWASGLAQARDDVRSAAIKTLCGYLLVWNESGNYYTLQITGNDVRQISTEKIQFNVDGMFLQVLTPTIKSFLKGDQKIDAKAVLAAHRDWEANFLESEYKEKLKIDSVPQTLANGEEALLWQFDVPKSAKSNVLKQTYLTLVKGERLLMLGGIVTEKISEKASHRLLLLTALSLRVSDKPTDLAKMQELLKDN